MEARLGSSMWRKRRRVSGMSFAVRRSSFGHRLRLRTNRRPAPRDRLLREPLASGAELVDRRQRVGGVERTVIAPVDRCHRRDVAGAEALEAADEGLAVLIALALPRRLGVD